MTIAGKTWSKTADRRVAESDGDANDGEWPTMGSATSAYQARRFGRTDRGRQEPSEGAVALAPGEEQREHDRSDREDERDERRRDASQRRRSGEADAQAGEDDDGADTAGADSGSSNVRDARLDAVAVDMAAAP